jgi:HK97 family phage major capsid protein
MAEEKTVDQLVGEVKSLVETKLDETRAAAEELKGRIDKSDKVTEGMTQKFDEAFKTFNEMKANLEEVEQKVAAFKNGGSQRGHSAGQQFVESDEIKSFMSNPTAGKRVGMDVKAIISSLTTDADGSAGDVLEPMRLPILTPVQRRLTVRDLLMPGTTSQGSIQYARESGFTNSADTHTETGGTTKPQSEIKFEIETTSVTTIAHFVIATRQILDDAPMLRSYIDGRLRYGLKLVEEDQLLNGGGTGTDLEGIYTAATASTANLGVVATPTKIDVIRYAMLQSSLAEYSPNGVVLHPTDWAGIETTKDTAGAYIIGNPQETATPRLWGLPVVATQAMTLDKFLVGAFDMGAQIFDREGVRVEISTEDASNFRQNLVTILCEERLALAIYRPAAFVKGDFSDQVTDLTS